MPKRPDKCKHFNGTQNDKCRANVVYSTIRDMKLVGMLEQYPCLVGGSEDKCPMYEPFSEKETADHEAEYQKIMSAMRRGVSACCDAPEDTSHVIESGSHKGHGQRYCSKCGKLLYMV